MTLHYMTNPFIISKHKSQFLSQLHIEGTATKAFFRLQLEMLEAMIWSVD